MVVYWSRNGFSSIIQFFKSSSESSPASMTSSSGYIYYARNTKRSLVICRRFVSFTNSDKVFLLKGKSGNQWASLCIRTSSEPAVVKVPWCYLSQSYTNGKICRICDIIAGYDAVMWVLTSWLFVPAEFTPLIRTISYSDVANDPNRHN